MFSTRQKILQHLMKYQPASIREIGKALDLSGPDILYHLRFLLKSGEIEPAQKESGALPLRGRPVKRYRLSRPIRPDNISMLTLALLEIFIPDGIEEQEKERRLKELARALVPSGTAENSTHTKILALVDYFTANHYAARWEAHRAGPQVIFSACPYLSILNNCPSLCTLDRLMIENYVSAPVSILQTYNESGKTIRQCRFSIHPLG